MVWVLTPPEERSCCQPLVTQGGPLTSLCFLRPILPSSCLQPISCKHLLICESNQKAEGQRSWNDAKSVSQTLRGQRRLGRAESVSGGAGAEDTGTLSHWSQLRLPLYIIGGFTGKSNMSVNSLLEAYVVISPLWIAIFISSQIVWLVEDALWS